MIALSGRTYELNKKFETDIGNWTYDDTDELLSRLPWRVRLFFPVKPRMRRVVQELQLVHEETGKQPRDIGQREVEKIRNELPNGKISWLEKMIGMQWAFNALVALAVIVIVILFVMP